MNKRTYTYLDGTEIELNERETIQRDEIKGCLFNNNQSKGKHEGRIYSRTEELNITKDDDDIRMMEHAGRFDGFNGGSEGSTNDAPAYIIPTMIKFNGNAKPLNEINPEIETIMTDECISNGKWNGKQTTIEIYNNIKNMKEITLDEGYDLTEFTIKSNKGIKNISLENYYKDIKTGKYYNIEDTNYKTILEKKSETLKQIAKERGTPSEKETYYIRDNYIYQTNKQSGSESRTTGKNKTLKIPIRNYEARDMKDIMKPKKDLKPAIKQILYPLTTLPALYYDDLRKCMDIMGRERIPYTHEKGLGSKHPLFKRALNYYKYDKELKRYIKAHDTPEEIIILYRERHPSIPEKRKYDYEINRE